MPFRKGESGNPGGRPKAATGLRKELDRRYGHNAKKLLDELDALRASENERVRLDALKLALAYHCGQPTQRIELEEEGQRVPTSVTFVITEQPGSRNRT